MPAAATQQAPKPAQSAPSAPQRQPQKSAALQRLAALPQNAGIALCALLLVCALFVGNARALQRATPKAFLRQGDVASIVEDRAAQARNAVTVAARASDTEAVRSAVEEAADQLESAKTAREISRADQKLTAAVSELVSAAVDGLKGDDASMLARAADLFAEQGSFLRQEARAFNEDAERAEKLYDRLPTRFLLSEPDVYEGI